MADHTHIEWTDATWNPITGCSVVSAGCKHCYAMKLAGSRLQHHPSRAGLTIDTSAGPVWNGQVRFNADWLHQPMSWRRPRRIFVCAHGDLFHESVPDEWIDMIFAVMALAPQHTFQVLTKRPARMRAYIEGATLERMLSRFEAPPDHLFNITRHELDARLTGRFEGAYKRQRPAWPLPNVWLGTSVEDQPTADERIPELLATLAAVRWISAEPLLGPIDLESINACDRDECYDLADGRGRLNALTGWCWNESKFGGDWEDNCQPPHDRGRAPDRVRKFPHLNWVVAGGESGRDARPMHPLWIQGLRDQCVANSTPFLFKQWGEWAPVIYLEADGTRLIAMASTKNETVIGDPLRPGTHVNMRRFGKKLAGRDLAGKEWNEYPEATTP